MFQKILIANRGEVAVRIIRACKEMGIKTVAVYSDADKEAMHTYLADESVCIGPAPVKNSYLNMQAIITAAVNTDAEAIHPGYGLLSENPTFAKLCEECNITFIGPSSEIISQMGDKDQARKTMKEAGVPIIEGSNLLKDAAEAREVARKIGFPLLIKAKAGGGGRGIRKVECIDDVESAFATASGEALSVFGDGGVYMEKFVSPAKHIEVQILGDNYGNVIALGERECSVQRNNQKILEESPSPAIDEKIRKKLQDVSRKAGESVNYVGLGTIEFIMDRDKNFYFMEMNTRLQVEHTVTEEVTGIDLVKWQIRIASGSKLDIKQDDVKINGVAIECRINTEDPYNNFLAQTGKITLLHIPGGPKVRFDTSVYQGYEIPPFYDSMIGKLIVHGKNREETIRKMKAALCEMVIVGVVVNTELQLEVLDYDDFVKGDYSTFMLDKLLKEREQRIQDNE